jgi:hypothetical protein
VVLLILIAIWAVVLIPPWVRSRREVRPPQSIASFNRRLSTLERTSPYSRAYADDMYLDSSHVDGAADGVDGAEVSPLVGEGVERSLPTAHQQVPATATVVSAASRRALRRRRQVFFSLVVAVGLSLGAAVVVGTITGWIFHGAVTLLLVGYVALLVRHHQRAIEQTVKVRRLPPVQPPRPAVVVLRSGAAR